MVEQLLSVEPEYYQPTDSEKRSVRSSSLTATQSTGLIKLPEEDVQEESEEVKEIKKMKLLKMKFEKMKHENLMRNERLKKQSKYRKQGSLDGCLYHHTYDYQTNIVKVDEN